MADIGLIESYGIVYRTFTNFRIKRLNDASFEDNVKSSVHVREYVLSLKFKDWKLESPDLTNERITQYRFSTLFT